MSEDDEVNRALAQLVGSLHIQRVRLEVKLRRMARTSAKAREREQKLQSRCDKLEGRGRSSKLAEAFGGGNKTGGVAPDALP